ncbi:hypothetical protein JCM14469_32730 [Desulfatiferula olefinivorans]
MAAGLNVIGQSAQRHVRFIAGGLVGRIVVWRIGLLHLFHNIRSGVRSDKPIYFIVSGARDASAFIERYGAFKAFDEEKTFGLSIGP